jgi:hypothetical protein
VNGEHSLSIPRLHFEAPGAQLMLGRCPFAIQAIGILASSRLFALSPCFFANAIPHSID